MKKLEAVIGGLRVICAPAAAQSPLARLANSASEELDAPDVPESLAGGADPLPERPAEGFEAPADPQPTSVRTTQATASEEPMRPRFMGLTLGHRGPCRPRRQRAASLSSGPSCSLGRFHAVPFRGSVRRIRSELRAQLTPGERVFYYSWTILILVLPLSAGGLTVLGRRAVRGAGIGLLFLTIVVYAVPVSPILQRRIRRREARGR